MQNRIFLCLLVGLINTTNVVQGDGLIEVFGWKQMDFYNRGDSFQRPSESNVGVVPPIRRDKDRVIFPDQLNKMNEYVSRFRYKRATMSSTSRDNPTPTTTETRLNSGSLNVQNSNLSSYIPQNSVPMGATHYRGRLFITIPRRRPGIPSTLNFVDMQKDGRNPSPKLNAYPNYKTNSISSQISGIVAIPERIISVYRTTVDTCGRLWFIDTGMLEYPDNRLQVQRPSIWVMDLSTDSVLRRFEIPESLVATGRGLASITVDINAQRCNQAFAYIPDLLYRQLYVYSFAQNRIWGFSHNYFNFDPLAGDLHIGGQTFRWDDGIFSITLGPQQQNGNRAVFFHPMASNNEFTVSNEVLQNEANAARSDHGQDFQLLGNRGNNRQSTMHEYDPRTGVIFYNEIQRNGIGCWNTKHRFSAATHGTVAQDAQRMIYPSDLTIDNDGYMWVVTNSLPIFIYSSLDPNTVNFRVWKQNVYNAVKNTICE